jgi:aspartyl protease family protein
MLVIWVGVGLLVYAMVSQRLLAPADAPAPTAATASSRPPAQTRTASPNTLVYHADKTGHVILDAVVNGAQLRFIVDTGATMVALTMQDAMAAGITRSSLDFSMKINTANGVARAAPVRLREIRLGQFSAYDVPATVSENLNISLLGNTFLKRLDSYEMRNGVLTLYWN